MSIYNFSFTKPNGQIENLSNYQGKVLLLVNTASKCGFTYQFDGLEKLYQHYKERGLVIIAFPCNQFANQEPNNDTEAEQFCRINFGVTFPVANKIDVNGTNADPLFTYLKENSQIKLTLKDRLLAILTIKAKAKEINSNDIKWNFTKFLIDRTGTIVTRFEPTIKPEQLEENIKILL